MSNFSNKI